ncbi:MAG: glycosyltransferase family 4 protein [Bacteroidetes bacterium]|nr:glycosyltransferase family 4 protein [Bacteroidota bacterium]
MKHDGACKNDETGSQQSTPIKNKKKKLKILVLTHHFSPDVGGIETNSEILADAFSKYGADVHVLTWTKFANADNFSFKVIRNPGIGTLLKEHRWADVIFENNPSLRLSWINFFIRKPHVIAVNTWINRIKGGKGWRDKLKNLWFRRADYVIAVSDAIRRKEWPKAVVIENPYNDVLFKKNNFDDNRKLFVFLGRLVSDKGADQAIKAVSMLIKKNSIDPDCLHLTIIGDGAERKKLIRLREELGLYGAIQFTGILKGEALVKCLNEHQFILVPSIWEEPYGNVVLEGMACGCIPIASNGGGMPEAVGNAGYIFQRNNLEDMVAVMEAALNDKDKMQLFRNNAIEHLKDHLSDLVSKKYFDLILAAAS